MFTVFGVVAAGICIFLLEGRLFFKQKKKKEMVIFSSLLLLAMTFNIVVALDLPIPSTAEALEILLKPIVKPIEQWIAGGSI